MKCIRCGSDTYPDTTTEAIDSGSGLLVIRNIPCRKCDECDEILYSGDVTLKLDDITQTVKHLAQDITIIDYAKTA